MGGKASRDKGGRVERYVVNELNNVSGGNFKRNLSQTRDSGHDIETHSHAIEVKGVETELRSRWFGQAVESARIIGKAAVVAHKRSRKPTVYWVEMSAEQFVSYDMENWSKE